MQDPVLAVTQQLVRQDSRGSTSVWLMYMPSVKLLVICQLFSELKEVLGVMRTTRGLEIGSFW